jgi:DNA repair protein RadC
VLDHLVIEDELSENIQLVPLPPHYAAASIILVHNHPSGDIAPSEDDVLLTRQLCLCGKVLGIEVIDHVIIGISGYTSFKKRNLM